MILTGVFIYNLRQPSTARKKTRENMGRSRRRKEEREEKGEVVSELQRAFFESHTYEMSDSKEISNHHYHHSQAEVATPTNVVSRLASKLATKLPTLPTRPTPANQSGMASSSRRNMRTFEDLAEEERGEGFFIASREGLIRERSNSSTSYGSVDKKGEASGGAEGESKRRTRRKSSGVSVESTK